jgi:hypothetical protein
MSEKVLAKPKGRYAAIISFPGGRLCVSDTPFGDHEPRVISWDPVINQISGGQDDITLTLENTTRDRLGNVQRRVSDFWSFDAPPEGSEVKIWDMPEDGGELLLFWGTVFEVESVTEEFAIIHVRSMDAKLDKLLGDPITLTEWPNAPDVNVGRRKPILYGSVVQFAPPLVKDLPVTQLTTSVLKTDATITVDDTTLFTSTGDIEINEEIITYTGTTATTFTGCSRGQSSTNAGSHAAGDYVVQKSTITFLVADHAVSSITNVKLVNTDGVKLLADASLFTAYTADPARIVFDRVPKVYIQSAGSIFKDIDTWENISPNSATNPLFACGRNPNWTEYNFAEIRQSQALVVARSSSQPVVHPPGWIKRAYCVIEHYGVSGLSSGTIDVSIDGTPLDHGGSPSDALTTVSNVPDEVKEDSSIHRETRGFQDTHGHTISNANHSHKGDSGSILHPDYHSTFTGLNPTYFYDENWNTFGTLNAGVPGDRQVDLKWSQVGNTLNTIRKFRVWHVHGGSGETKSINIHVFLNGVRRYGPTLISSSGSYTVWNSGTPTDISGLGLTMVNWTNSNSFIELDTGVGTGLHYGYESWLEVWDEITSDNENVGQPSSETPLNRSSYTWFDITSMVTGATDEAKWRWFHDKKIECTENGIGASDVDYVLRAFFCVEFVNAEKEFTKEIVCDVASTKAATGDGATVLSDIAITLGGIPLANVDTDSFTTAAGKSPNVYGGALEDFETIFESLKRIGEQMRISIHPEAGKLTALFKDRVSALGSPAYGIRTDDILKGTFTLSRLPFNQIFNAFRINYDRDFLLRDYKSTYLQENATSQAQYGRTEEYVVDADFIKTEAEATNLANQLEDYMAWIVDVVEMVLTRDWIHLKRGDLISVEHRLGAWGKMEVLKTEIQPGGRGQASGVKILAIERRVG